MAQEGLTLEENITLSLLGIGIALLFLLCTLYRSSISRKRRNTSERKQRASQTHENCDQTIAPWSWDITGYFRYPRRFVFALSTSEEYSASRRLIPYLFYRIWQKYRYGRVLQTSSPKHSNNMASDSFPLTRLVSTTDLVVAYSKEFVSECSSSPKPKPKGKRKRYALILKSASPEAKAEIERYFGAVVEDILSVRQVSSFVYILMSGSVTPVHFRFPGFAFPLRLTLITVKYILILCG